MKTNLIFIIFFGILSMNAQITHELDWERDMGSNVDLTILEGDTVRWTWIDNNHTVENDPNGTSVETFDSGFLADPGSTFSYTFTVLGSNDYYCGVHGATSMSGTITVNPALGVDDLSKVESFKIYPNPTKSMLNIELTEAFARGRITIYDFLGKVIFTRHIESEIVEPINSTNWESGMYLIEIELNNRKDIKRFIKQ